ncbi:MAG TPA: serine/threonine-protein kinase [Gemmataceae bacterium]|nr:serine/threonine-protein kinase [Gemmataceae bacterium]
MPPLPRVPGFDLLRPLGGGPLTEVFAARRHADDRPVALKVPREIWPGHTTAVRLLRREYRALRSVRHPSIVRMLDAHVTDPPYFLALDYLDGETLRDRLQRDYCLELRSAAWIGRQTAEALAALHRAGFIHGDVKPENVRLLDDGTAVLVDLGFTHRPGENGIFADDGYVLGTANYLAPELRGDPPRDGTAADWYSFGVMLFEMLTGTLPRSIGFSPDGAAEDSPGREPWAIPQKKRSEPRRGDTSISPLRGFRIFNSTETQGSRPGLSSAAPPGLMPDRLAALLDGLLAKQPSARPVGALIIHELIALEIAALGRGRAA